MIKSDWFTVHRCIKCRRILNEWTVMYSSGRCPKCGYKDPRACTIVETTEHACRLVYNRKWWQFWVKPEVEYRDDEKCV